MRNGMYRALSNRPIAQDTYEMILTGDMSFAERPGQFVNVKLDGLYLRRPISICDWDEQTMTLVYKVVGRGTRQMAAMRPGQELDLLCGLGNGFDGNAAGAHSLLVGGGVGAPPLYGLAKRLAAQGKKITVVLGFGRAEQAFYQKEFEALGCPVLFATEDGSLGEKGFVTQPMSRVDYDYYFACGPMPMLRAIKAYAAERDIPAYISLEEHMACGVGACLGCVVKTKEIDGHSHVHNARICTEGPVFEAAEVEI